MVVVVEEPPSNLFSRRACWMAARSNFVWLVGSLVVSVMVFGMVPPPHGETCAKSSNQKT